MQNPYSTPAAITEPEIQLLPEQEFLLVGSSFYCRSNVDISEYCFLTGEKTRYKVKTLRLNGTPPIYQCLGVTFWITWMLIFSIAGEARPESRTPLQVGTIPISLIFIVFNVKHYFIKLNVGFTKAMAWQNFRIELVQAGLMLAASLASMGFAYILERVFSQLPILLGCMVVFFIAAMLVTFNYFGTRQSKLSITRIGVNLFRVDNLPSELLAKLRETSGADDAALN